MSSSEARAQQVLQEAEKKAAGGSGFFSKLFGSDSAGEAVTLYVQAGNLFKSCQSWKSAGDAFLKAAVLCSKSADSQHDCATHFAEAGNCYRKIDAAQAIDCYQKTCDIYTDMGRFTMAAKNHMTIAELYEKELPDLERAIQHYQKAADYYKGEEQRSTANKCLIFVAKFSAQLEQYRNAIQVFEEIAMWEADHPTLKYNAKNHFFQALLCHLCIDSLDTQHALNRYENAAPSFADSREYKFVKELIAAVEENNEETFTSTVATFDRISRLDDWHTALLLKIKKHIAAAEDDEDDLR